MIEDAHYWECVKSLLDSLAIDLVIDVGANIGQFARGLRDVGYRGIIASFEPIPELAESLRTMAKGDPCWIIYGFALGATKCQTEFAIPATTLFASMRKPSQYAREQFAASFDQTRRVSVRVARLQDVFRDDVRLAGAKRVFLKLDTQGFDLEVFRGVGEINGKIALLQSELSLKPLYENMPGLTESLDVYRESGFLPCGFFPVCRDQSNGFLVEVDCLLLRGVDEMQPSAMEASSAISAD